MNDISQLLETFRPPAFPGSLFLSFEGIEGAGKSTQIVRVKEYLESKDFRVIVLREPGGTSFGEKLRQAILGSKNPIHPVSEMHLFASSRAQLLTEVTMKELNTPGTVVIYDRYIDSSIAYQGKGRGLGTETILKTHQTFPLTLMPHKTFYLKIDPELSYRRQKIRNAPKDYFEKQGLEFYQKLVEGYEEALSYFPNRIAAIDGAQGEMEVFDQIKNQLDQLILEKSKNINEY